MFSKTLKYFLVGLFLVILIGLLISEISCGFGEACKCSPFSSDRETAIKEGFYIDTYQPLKKSIAIPNTKDTIHFAAAWTEHTWQTERRLGLCLLEHRVKGDGYNFCLPFSTVNSNINSYPFVLKQLQKADDPYFDPGGNYHNRFNFGLNALTDTIKVIVQNKMNRQTGDTFIDTAVFIRTTTGLK